MTMTFSYSKDAILLLPSNNLDIACPMGYFQCNTTTQCVQQRLNCDGSADCDDASDEWNCVNELDAKYWDHLFRKQPYGRNDDIPIGTCYWPSGNLSCPCRGNDLLCRFQHLTSIPINLPIRDVSMLDLTGNNFTNITATFLDNMPMTDVLVLKFCSIIMLAEYAFQRFSSIPVKSLYLGENKITFLPDHLFPPGNLLKVLILSRNRIKVLYDYNFLHLDELIELDLRGNRLESFEADVFRPLRKLESLYLNENLIHHLRAGMFPTLWHLQTLSLANNRIQDIERKAFPMPQLKHLFLAGNMLTVLKARIFCNLNKLRGLHLNENKLNAFHSAAFACLENLTSLFLTDNDFRILEPAILQNLTKLDYIYFSWFHLCRAAMHVRVCEPHGDGISSTYHLLDNPILRASVWVMASIAVIGNMLVLLGRYLHKTRTNVEHSLYLRHLAASDFLMGIYLTIIAYKDITFRGEYIFYEEMWRHSNMCAFSGFLSTFSCQSSTLLLTLVTWDRLISIMNPLRARDVGKKRIVVRLLLLWSISFVLAATPLYHFDYFGRYFYGTNGVCLSLHIHDPYAKGWEYSAVLFICINTFSLIFILVSYTRMLQAIRDSGDGMRSTLSGRESIVATRFAIIITTDCICWLPIIIVKLAALSGCTISPALYAWLAVLVLPVNSALNPILYTLTTAVFKQQLLHYLNTVPTCMVLLIGQRNNHTQLAYDSALSTSLGHFGSNKSNSSRKRSTQRRFNYV